MTKPGDDVFARVKGHSPWPATVLQKISRNKFKVFFFGTYQLGFVKDEQIWDFDEKVEEFSAKKYAKKQDYVKALEEIREKRTGEYRPGEKIFAKLKRHGPWPAKVIAVTSLQNFHVLFYGKSTNLEEVELANMWKYQEKSEEFGAKYGNKAGYASALKLMEEDAEITLNDPIENEIANEPCEHVIDDEEVKVSIQMDIDLVDSEPHNEEKGILPDIATNHENDSADTSKPTNDKNDNMAMDVECCIDHAQPNNQENVFTDNLQPTIIVETVSTEDQPRHHPQEPVHHHHPEERDHPPQEPTYLRPTFSSLSKQVSPARPKPFVSKPPWKSSCKSSSTSLSPSLSTSLSPSPSPNRSPSPSPNSSPCRSLTFNSHMGATSPNLSRTLPNRVASIKRIKVQVRDLTFLIPITGEHLSVLWLSKEAGKRYLKKEGREPVLKLTTLDKAELDPADLLCDLFFNEDVILASQILGWKN